MREFKFRAFDCTINKMVEWESISNLPVDYLFNGMQNHGGLDIMQYTGLRDKNGKEIYEGDIMKFTCFYGDDDDYIDKIERIGEVFFKTEGAIDYCIRVHREGNFCLNSCDIGGYEIIGNIYENPELLEI